MSAPYEPRVHRHEEEDWSERDIDPGDYVYCNDCGEWVLPVITFETNYDVHRVLKRYSCRGCGTEWEAKEQ